MGPSIDIGPEMMAKIMKSNMEVVHCSTYRGLKEDRNSNQAHTSLRKYLDNSIRDRYGPENFPDGFPNVNFEDTPLYYMYEDDTTDA